MNFHFTFPSDVDMVTTRTDFMLIREAHIDGFNNLYISGVDQNSCASTCADSTDFTCRSFDYKPSTNECWLSEENDKTQATGSGSTYHLFVRICEFYDDYTTTVTIYTR